MTQDTAEYDRIRREVEEARLALNSTRWWQLKRREAADRYKRALFLGALWEIHNGVTPPGSPADQEADA